MTREEIKAIGKHIADKVFHRKHKEVKIEGMVVFTKDAIIVTRPSKLSENDIVNFPKEILKDFESHEFVEITIKSKE